MVYKRTKIILPLLLLMITMMVSAQRVTTTSDAERKEIAKKTLALDYSMLDYNTKEIEATVMESRLAKILGSFCANYKQAHYLGTLSVIQSNQVEGLNYGRIKSMKLENVSKTGNDLTIRFNTASEPNNLNLNRSQLVLYFIDGISEDIATNDFFCTLCRYIKE